MKNNFSKGDKVRVNDPGLIMLQQFAPPGSKPNNEGVISAVKRNGYYEIWFPVGNDDPKKHSQSSIYHRSYVELIQNK